MVLDPDKYYRIKTILLDLECPRERLESLKVYFKEDINSERTFERIISLNILWKTLEKRDVLNSRQEQVLQVIIDKVASQYERENIMRILNHTEWETLGHRGNIQANSRIIPPIPNTLVERINEEVKNNIGVKWKELARGLNVPEGKIDELEFRYKFAVEGMYMMIHSVLQSHLERSGSNFEHWRVGLQQALRKARRTDLSENIDEILRFHS
ncbi:fas-associated death domain protein [Euwallacea fornicatus]|uniref:fas-associated death domain protein n=1 Tax=Euwallacea fornicatus TaxID=995702 RepID=UPI00338DC90B